MKRSMFITAALSVAVLVAASVLPGCVSSPTPTPVATVTPMPSIAPTTAPTATLIGGNDEAHIVFTYDIGTASDYDGQKASPGNTFYILDVKVDSDKPVYTSMDWIKMEYKVNDSDQVQEREPFGTTFKRYPSTPTLIGGGKAPLEGRMMFELPVKEATGYPKPVYYLPMDQQTGTYKVYDKVYGTKGLQ